MFGVYKIVTWDDVSYTLIKKFDNEATANRFCKLMNDKRKYRKECDCVCYRVITDLQYYNLMH